MLKHKPFFILVVIVHVVSIPNFSSLFSQEQAPQISPEIQQAVNRALVNLQARVDSVWEGASDKVQLINDSVALVYHANSVSIQASERVNELLNRANEAVAGTERVQASQVAVEQRAQTAATDLEREYNRLSTALVEDAARAEQQRAQQNDQNLERVMQIERARIGEMHHRGIYAEGARIQAQGTVDAEAVKWTHIRAMVDDPKNVLKIILAVSAIALTIYAAKYGIPVLMNYLTQPCVVSETSKTGWFDWKKREPTVSMNDLIFAPAMHNKLSNLLLRVQTAKKYDENLPNVLLYGSPGTGKTAFAKALAYDSGLNYALTSGSEFAKITDLNAANNELRKLLKWAQDDDKGLVVFIDEAESLFANRKLPTTPKSTQDFINTFLALVPEKSQKNLMFVFATNHPFKLDTAITNRVGIQIEFPLPAAPEREKILATYLEKFAQENEEVCIDFHPEIKQLLTQYAKTLEGLSPRAIKFIAEEMIVRARRQDSKELTNDLAQAVLDESIESLQQTVQWEKERDQWTNSLVSVRV